MRGFFPLSPRHKGFLSNSAGDWGEKSANPSDKGTEEMKFQFFLVFDTEKGKQKKSQGDGVGTFSMPGCQVEIAEEVLLEK